MRLLLLTFPLLALVGCATHRPVAVVAPPPPLIPEAQPTKVMETRYDVRGYREASNPSIRHEAHAIYRQTRVPLNANDMGETVPRTAYAPASYAPLPATAEVDAELANQKAITGELRAMKAAMAETQQRMEAQYAVLVRQSAEATKLRGELEAARERLRTAPPGQSSDVAATTGSGNTEAKW
jgi:hypothetical protein